MWKVMKALVKGMIVFYLSLGGTIYSLWCAISAIFYLGTWLGNYLLKRNK